MTFEYGLEIGVRAKFLTVEGFKKASDAAKKMSDSVVRSASRGRDALDRFVGGFDRIGGLAVGGLKALTGAATAATAAVVAFSFQAAESNDQLLVWSQRLGVGAEQLSALRFAASSAGVEAEHMDDALKELNLRVKEDTDSFRKMGVQVFDSSGKLKTADQLLLGVADAMQKQSSAAVKTALADKLMGEAGAQLIPLLQNGSAELVKFTEETKKSGLAVTEFEAQAGNKFMTSLGRSQQATKGLWSAISGQLAPVMTVLSDKYNQASGAATRWIRTNRQLIQSGIQEFLQWMADSAIPAIATGINLVSSISTGWKLIIEGIRLAWNSFVSEALSGTASILSDWAKMADKLGLKGVAGSLKEMVAGWKDSSKASDKAAADARVSMGHLIEKQRSFDALISNLGVKGSSAIRSVGAETQKLFDELVKAEGAAKSAEKAVGSLGVKGALKAKGDLKRMMNQAQARLELSNRMRELELKDLEWAAAEQEKALERTKALYERWVGVGQQAFGDIMGAAQESFQGIGDSFNGQTKSMDDAWGQFFLKLGVHTAKFVSDWALAKAKEAFFTKQAAVEQVTANAAVAGSAAAGSQAGIPYIGPVLAIAAMATVLTGVLGLLSGFNSGGIVGGPNGPNRDSVFARLTTGEMVIDRATTQQLASLIFGGQSTPGAAGSATAPPSRGPGSGGGGGGMVVERLEIQSLGPPASAHDMRRMMVSADYHLRQARSLGVLDPSRRR